MAADGASLLRQHRDLLARLPVTFRAFVGVEAQRWPTLFAPEKAYLEALLDSLARPDAADLADGFGALMRLETDARCRDVRESDPRKLQDATQALLRSKGLLPRWRQQVDEIFRRVQPRIDAQLHGRDAPRRLVVILYGTGIAIQRDELWRRLGGLGWGVPLRTGEARASEPFLRELFAAGANGSFWSALRDSAGLGPHESWIVEAGDSLHALSSAGAPDAPACATGLSYVRLRAYREALAQSLYRKVQSGDVSGPRELAAYARTLDLEPPPGSLLHSDEVVRAFTRELLLSGNGTLLFNNTFVEWACVQALKRAEPRLLAARFGVRDKPRPFSSLLLFASPGPTDEVPIEDPLGSFVDVEQFSYYIWLNAEKSAAYRGKTLYLLLAEGVDEMLAIRSDAPRSEPGRLPEATLPSVAATMAAWLGVPPASSARPIAALLG